MIGEMLYALLSENVEGATGRQQWSNLFKLPSRRRIFSLTGFFSADTFTTSMVMQSLIAYWFSSWFGLQVESLAVVFFFSHVIITTSL